LLKCGIKSYNTVDIEIISLYNNENGHVAKWQT
jgi:hypothetical protein